MLGHNRNSLAMHHGYYAAETDDYELAKKKMNVFVLKSFKFKKTQAKTLVDAGCGVGGTAIHFSEMMPKLKVIGINLSRSQLLLATQFAKEKNVSSNIKFIQSDYSQMELGDSSVDGVYGIESICHAADKVSFYKEANRVLRSAGRLVICDYFLNEPKLNEEHRLLLQVFQEGWAIPDCHVKFREQLQKSGFADIKFSNISKRVIMGIERSSTRAKRKLPLVLNGTPSPMEKHLQACIALNTLIKQEVICYGVLFATKV